MVDLNSTIHRCDDADVIAGYLAHAELAGQLRGGAIDEAKARWNRLPVGSEFGERHAIVGIARAPLGWDWGTARDEFVERTGKERWLYREESDPALVPPAGWRKLVKDSYLTPPKKGSSPEILEARAFCKKWSHESLRGYLKRVHGAPIHHFAGMRFLTIGIDVEEDALWVVSGPEYEIEDKRFKPVLLSEYVAMRERNPRPEKTQDEEL